MLVLPDVRLSSSMRTFPTTYQQATMNRRNLRSFELHLSLLQLVSVLGVVTGSMAVAFYVGFGSGHSTGYEEASSSHLVKAIKLPIADEELEGVVSEDKVSQVYAKLRETAPSSVGFGSGEEQELPELTSIDEAPQKLASPEELVRNTELDGPQNPTLGELAETAIGKMEEKTVPKETTVARKVTEPAQSVELSVEDALPKDSGVVEVMGSGKAVAVPKRKTLGGVLTLEDKEIAQEAPRLRKEPPREMAKATEKVQIASEEKTLVPPPVTFEKKIDTSAKTSVVARAEKTANGVRTMAPPTTRKKVTTASMMTPATSRVSTGWYAQVAAPQRIQDATSLASKIRSAGFPVAVQKAEVRGERYYRVMVGPEDTRTLATRLVGQLKREAFISGQPFIKKVK